MTTSVGGTVTCEFSVPPNTPVTMSANVPAPSTPGVFSTNPVTAGSVPADCTLKSTCAFTITEDSTITATFDFDTYHDLFRTLSITLAGAGDGEITADGNRCQTFDPRQASGCPTSYATGSLVTLEARPPAGSLYLEFSNGTFDAAGCATTSPSCSFRLNIDSSVTATFAALGSITVNPLSASINVGQMQAFSATGTFVNGAMSRDAPLHGDMGTWKFKTDMPTPRFGLAAGVLNGLLYAIGGVDASPLATVEAYSPSLNTWSSEPPMSTPREGLAAAVADGMLYAIGGTTTGGAAVSSVEAYTPAAGWNPRAPMSIARRGLAAGVLNGRVYAIGGRDDLGHVFDTVEEYDPASNSWETKAPMPTARWSLAAGVVNGILYALGGQDSSGNILATVEAYDPVTNTWSTTAPMPSPRELHGVAVIDNQLYAVGGNFGGFLSSLVAYDPTTDNWFFKAFMPNEEFFDRSGSPMARGELAAASIEGILYAVGGHQVQMVGSPPMEEAVAIPILQAFTDTLVWGTSDATIATISQFGQASGQQAGTATLTARTGTITCETTSTCGTLTVNDIPLSVTIFGSSSATINEGQSISRGGSFRDPSGDAPWTATVDYGDGGGAQPLTLTISPPGGSGPTGTFSLNHPYSDNGSYMVTVTVRNGDGDIGTATLPVTVNNVAPMVFLPRMASTEVGSTTPWACASFRDPGTGDAPWSATVDYGDGTGAQTVPAADIRVPGSCGGPGGPLGPTGAFNLSHTYTHSGVFTVTVTVMDKDGGAGTNALQVEVMAELVSIAVTPVHASILVGQTQQFIATGTFSDGSTQSTDPNQPPGDGPAWSSTNSAVASVTQNGLATGLAPGQTIIVAEFGRISCLTTNGCATLTVTSPNRAPVCSAAAPTISEIWPPNHDLVPVGINGVTDADGDDVTITISSIFQDEPTNDGGDGNTPIDGFGVGARLASVRAERSGRGNGRVYHISFTATDTAGARCSGAVTAAVPHDNAHPAVDDGPRYDSTR